MEKMTFTLTDAEVAAMSPDERTVHEVRKVQAENPDLSYADAQMLVFRRDPKLAKAYADGNGFLNADGAVVRPLWGGMTC